jgi:hypothetical protein
MGRKHKKYRNKQAGKRTHAIKADEVFEYGPLTVARFGRYVQFSNEATPEQQAEMLKRTKEAHQDTLKELEIEAPALQALVRKYDAVELMHRAAYELLPLFMKHRTESEYTPEETYSLPTVEYIQYVTARTAVTPGAPRIEEDEWDVLWTQAKKVMELMNSYLFTRSTLTKPPTEIDSLRFSSDQMRLMVRVHRYPAYLADYLRTSLQPFEAEIRAIHGVGVEHIVAGLLEIDQYQKSGVISRYADMMRASTTLQEEMTKAGYNPTATATPEEDAAVKAALASEFKDKHEDAQEKTRLTLTPAIFDITDLTSLPKSVLSLLSVKPGESILTSLTGPAPDYEDLSPLSISPLHYKPFVEADGKFYTFYHSGFEDHMAEIIETDLFERYPKKRGKLEKARSDLIEITAKDLIAGVVGADFAHVNAYYPNPDQPGLTELDGLVGVDDVLFLIEVKSGGFSEAARRGAPKDLTSTLSDLIFEGQRQSERAQRYIMSGGSVDFYDESGKNVVQTIKHGDYRKIFRVVVTKEELGWVGAQLAQLSVLDPTLATSLPWQVSISDLRAVAELFSDNKLRFTHYLEQRLTAGENQELTQHDEIDHVGLYNKINHYHDLPFKSGGRMTFDASYIRDIDLYFSAKSSGEQHELPTQSMPPKMRAFLDHLAGTQLAGRFQLGSHLLDLDTKGREQFEQLLKILEGKNENGRQATIRMPINALAFGVSFTLARGENFEKEMRRSAVQMGVSECESWLVVLVAGDDSLETVRIEIIGPSTYTPQELADTRAEMEAAGTQSEINIRKPGRNQPCYCGSGKKYKKCHGSVL